MAEVTLFRGSVRVEAGVEGEVYSFAPVPARRYAAVGAADAGHVEVRDGGPVAVEVPDALYAERGPGGGPGVRVWEGSGAEFHSAWQVVRMARAGAAGFRLAAAE